MSKTNSFRFEPHDTGRTMIRSLRESTYCMTASCNEPVCFRLIGKRQPSEQCIMCCYTVQSNATRDIYGHIGRHQYNAACNYRCLLPQDRKETIKCSSCSASCLTTVLSKTDRSLLLILLLLLLYDTDVPCHRPFLSGTSLEPALIPTAQASSFTLQYFPYYV